MKARKQQAAQAHKKTRSFWCVFLTLLASTVLLRAFKHPACIWFYIASLAFCEGFDADFYRYQLYLMYQPFKRWFLKKHSIAAYRRHCYGICALCVVLGLIGLTADAF